MLSLISSATKSLEGDSTPTMAIVISINLGILIELETPEPSNRFSFFGNLPKAVAKELRRRFIYAIGPITDAKFLPLFAVASILHPAVFQLISSDENLISAGKSEIDRWIKRLSQEHVIIPPTTQKKGFGDLRKRLKPVVSNLLQVNLTNTVTTSRHWRAYRMIHTSFGWIVANCFQRSVN